MTFKCCSGYVKYSLDTVCIKKTLPWRIKARYITHISECKFHNKQCPY